MEGPGTKPQAMALGIGQPRSNPLVQGDLSPSRVFSGVDEKARGFIDDQPVFVLENDPFLREGLGRRPIRRGAEKGFGPGKQGIPNADLVSRNNSGVGGGLGIVEPDVSPSQSLMKRSERLMRKKAAQNRFQPAVLVIGTRREFDPHFRADSMAPVIVLRLRLTDRRFSRVSAVDWAVLWDESKLTTAPGDPNPSTMVFKESEVSLRV